jgi:glycine betaine/choline ABC-type transport system substrate-binding protein
VAVNDKTVTDSASIGAAQTVELRSPLPAGQTDISIRYTGTKTLVLLETGFE